MAKRIKFCFFASKNNFFFFVILITEILDDLLLGHIILKKFEPNNWEDIGDKMGEKKETETDNTLKS